METSKPVLKINDKVRLELNALLADLQNIEEAATRQNEAGVPEMEAVIDRCQDCRRRIAAFKEVNFAGKK